VVYTANLIRKFHSKSNRTADSIRDSIRTQKNDSQVPSFEPAAIALTVHSKCGFLLSCHLRPFRTNFLPCHQNRIVLKYTFDIDQFLMWHSYLWHRVLESVLLSVTCRFSMNWNVGKSVVLTRKPQCTDKDAMLSFLYFCSLLLLPAYFWLHVLFVSPLYLIFAPFHMFFTVNNITYRIQSSSLVRLLFVLPVKISLNEPSWHNTRPIQWCYRFCMVPRMLLFSFTPSKTYAFINSQYLCELVFMGGFGSEYVIIFATSAADW